MDKGLTERLDNLATKLFSWASSHPVDENNDFWDIWGELKKIVRDREIDEAYRLQVRE